MSNPATPSLFSLSNPFAIAGSLWKERELLRQFTLRNVELRHKGSHLGLIWSFLNPLLMLGLYLFVFGFIFKGTFGDKPGETRWEYGLGMFIGLTFFHFFSELLGSSTGVITGNPNFVKKVIFPLEVLPAAGVGAATFHMLISMGLVLIGVVVRGPGLHAGMLWLPVIILPLILICLGLAWLLAALGVFLRDTSQIIPFLTTVLMWCSAVVYSPSKLDSFWKILKFNPLLLAIEQARNAVLWQLPLNPAHIGYLYLFGIAAFVSGYAVFRKLKPAFADVL